MKKLNFNCDIFLTIICCNRYSIRKYISNYTSWVTKFKYQCVRNPSRCKNKISSKIYNQVNVMKYMKMTIHYSNPFISDEWSIYFLLIWSGDCLPVNIKHYFIIMQSKIVFNSFKNSEVIKLIIFKSIFRESQLILTNIQNWYPFLNGVG